MNLAIYIAVSSWIILFLMVFLSGKVSQANNVFSISVKVASAVWLLLIIIAATVYGGMYIGGLK